MNRWLLMLALVGAFTLRAEEKQTEGEREKAEAKAEDDAEALANERARLPVTISGTLNLVQYDVTKIPDVVIGQMTSKGVNYLLKVPDANVLKRIEKYSGKPVTLSGKTRNKGKYFIIGSVIEAAPAPVERKKRGGM